MNAGRIVMLICVYLLVHVYGHAQVDIQQIKYSSNYWYAEGQGATIDDASRDALSQIINQISVSVSSKTQEIDNSGQTADGVSYSSYTQEGSVKSFSFASLQNVHMMVLHPEPGARVFRWVEKNEVDKMFERRKNKILDFVETGKLAERDLQIDDALRNYYWALMLARSNRDAVYADFNGESVNCLVFLPIKIKSVLSHLKVKIEDCIERDNRYYLQGTFIYDGKAVSSLQLDYFDGQSFVGPLTVRDGVAELELLSLPVNEKVQVRYEYSFRKQGENLDTELRTIFSEMSAPVIENAFVEIPVKVNARKGTVKMAKKYEKEGFTSSMALEPSVAAVATETIQVKKRIEVEGVEDDASFQAAMKAVESAIKQCNPECAFAYFTSEGYKLFEQLLKHTGRISLVGSNQQYHFVRANGQVLGKDCKVKIRFSNGRSFMEKLTFRFDEKTKKIQSLALALTKKAEDDIFNAASTWPEVSRYTILQFMEDYQTAYLLQRIDYLDKIFSDDAIIITGTMLKTAPKAQVEGLPVDFGKNDIRYTRLNKKQFIEKLRTHFNEREYVHLTFEDNVTQVINAPSLPPATAFVIQIRQIYNSPVYSDQGYLTLVLDASKELPIIHVRMWQPDKSDMMSIEEFMSKFKF